MNSMRNFRKQNVFAYVERCSSTDTQCALLCGLSSQSIDFDSPMTNCNEPCGIRCIATKCERNAKANEEFCGLCFRSCVQNNRGPSSLQLTSPWWDSSCILYRLYSHPLWQQLCTPSRIQRAMKHLDRTEATYMAGRDSGEL